MSKTRQCPACHSWRGSRSVRRRSASRPQQRCSRCSGGAEDHGGIAAAGTGYIPAVIAGLAQGCVNVAGVVVFPDTVSAVGANDSALTETFGAEKLAIEFGQFLGQTGFAAGVAAWDFGHNVTSRNKLARGDCPGLLGDNM